MTYECIALFTPFSGGDKAEKYICITAESEQEAIDRVNDTVATANEHYYEFERFL